MVALASGDQILQNLFGLAILGGLGLMIYSKLKKQTITETIKQIKALINVGGE